MTDKIARNNLPHFGKYKVCNIKIIQKRKIIFVKRPKNKNVISWGAVTGADGYEIERKLISEDEFTTWVKITDSSVLTYTDILNDVSGVYEYRVLAVSGDDEAYSVSSRCEFTPKRGLTIKIN